ncbi:hypothetical protein ACFWYW_24060 [Nonomuraea sp. NPDC059023]|uniref:hypothetical protein n=1 Tax=unclassified Nonomuraea TaxID=2593643 RepID=UPI0036968C48
MQVTYTQRHHVNMGAYEWIEYTASATVFDTDFPDADNVELGDLLITAREQVQQTLAADIARATSLTAENESYVHVLAEQNTQNIH